MANLRIALGSEQALINARANLNFNAAAANNNNNNNNNTSEEEGTQSGPASGPASGTSAAAVSLGGEGAESGTAAVTHPTITDVENGNFDNEEDHEGEEEDEEKVPQQKVKEESS